MIHVLTDRVCFHQVGTTINQTLKTRHSLIWVNIVSGNGLVPDGTKPLPEPMLTYHQEVKCQSSRSTWWRHQMETFSALLATLQGIHGSPVNSPHKRPVTWSLMFSLICAWINDWVNNREAGDLRRYHAHYDVILMNCETATSAINC